MLDTVTCETMDQIGADTFFAALTKVHGLGNMSALDMFARNGSLTLRRYANLVHRAEAWELNQEHWDALLEWLPADQITTGHCSYKLLRQCQRQYDMIVVDSPQGLYKTGAGRTVAEHFELLPHLAPIMADRCLVVLYVNKEPYDKNEDGQHGYDQYAEYDFEAWMVARERFYLVNDGRFVTDADAVQTYEYMFEKIGFDVESIVSTPCLSGVVGMPPAFRLGMMLTRR